MSTLWTPGGEVPVGDRSSRAPDDSAASDGSAASDAAADFDLDSLSPEEREQAEQYIRELAESRERLKAVPASVVVANHAMGLYELAALHLSNQPPNFVEGAVAIDALGALLDGMKGRLGEAESTLQDALSQIRMAFVQLKNRPEDGDTGESGGDGSEDDPAA
ncbi:MAG: hypothetical protein F4Y99_06895 [Acidimicrobiaceae bacterium]|nr:hypothetical protein [Acidimicrobiaceae bacterium]MDE0516421.1 hypothetical protein [Acidimicrobiaceae bacterium]MDE0657587.1 hypothetical protein [Acidimicrobiaceae bacterium]MXZ95635.1 hypothetical protein [Acidimicrobiaceae bacterium]MYF42508.1 hypothetical protein [Acidimicrobiaceae bacterium]